MHIKIEGISKKFDTFEAVKNVDIEVADGEILALLGSSGCGKTTLLRIVAGLIDQTEGNIWFDDENITKWPAQKRNAAMVFQNYALFPHMNLEENIGYGLKVRRMPRQVRKERINSALEQVELSGLNKRKIQELSGGQKQRAALARALVTEPDVLLFDEPLSNLDEKLRLSMRKEIRRIQQETKITAIYVTHDLKEAMAIADKIAVMNKGEIMQWGRPEEILRHPKNAFTAYFMGHVNLYKYDVPLEQKGVIRFLGKNIKVKPAPDGKPVTGLVHVLLPPEEINISLSNDQNDAIEGVVLDYELSGNMIRYHLKVQDRAVYVDQLLRMSVDLLKAGQQVYIRFDEATLHFF